MKDIQTEDAEYYNRQRMQDIIQTEDAGYFNRQRMQDILTDRGCRIIIITNIYRQQMQNSVTDRCRYWRF